MLWLAVQLCRRRYDVYHVHGAYWFALVPTIFARLLGTGMVVKITRLDDDDAETVSSRRFGPLPAGWIYGWPQKSADLVVAVNGRIATRHKAHFPAVPVASLPNGVDPGRFAAALEHRDSTRHELGISPQTVVVLFSGLLAARKGFDALLDAWAVFSSCRPDTSAPIMLLAAGPGRGFYRELSDGATPIVLEAQPTIRYLGSLQPDAMPALYAAADIFILPTESEGMPNSLLEARAAGLPSIVCDVPGVTELLHYSPGSYAVLESPTSLNIQLALATMTEKVTKNAVHNSQRQSLLPATYSLESLAATYLDLYRVLVENPVAARRVRLESYLDSTPYGWERAQ